MKQYQSLTVLLDAETIEALRQMAVQRGLIVSRGPNVGKNYGSITKLLKQLAQEAQHNKDE